MFAATDTKTRTTSIGRFVAVVMLAVAASVVIPAWADDYPARPGGGTGLMGGPGGAFMGGRHGAGPGFGGYGMEGHGGRGFGLMFGSPEQIDRMADRMLDGLNASDAQRTQIKQIAQATVADMKAQREAGRALHAKGLQIFAAPTVDAAAAEALRQQMVGQRDQASKRVLQAMLDISKVLTPEQRAKFAERIQQRGDITRDRQQRFERLHQAPPQKS